MSKLVAVSGTRRTDEGRERVTLNTAYVRALAGAGLVPLVVPPILAPEAACSVLDQVQGLVLTGGEDVDPGRYGAVPHSRIGSRRARAGSRSSRSAGASRSSTWRSAARCIRTCQ